MVGNPVGRSVGLDEAGRAEVTKVGGHVDAGAFGDGSLNQKGLERIYRAQAIPVTFTTRFSVPSSRPGTE